jgi:hypothetical protein
MERYSKELEKLILEPEIVNESIKEVIKDKEIEIIEEDVKDAGQKTLF